MRTKALAINQDVPTILNTLDKELKDLKEITDKPYVTSGVTSLYNSSVDIKDCTDVELLQKLFSSILGKKKVYDEAGKLLELSSFKEFNQDGGTLEQWQQDIKTRLAVLQYEARKNKLQEFKDKMSKFLSEEDQKKVLLSEMRTFLDKE